MKKAEYRKYICEMIGKIRSKKRLKRIYTVVHRLYLHDVAENGEEVHTTEGERLRENIDKMLDKLNADELKGVDIFLFSCYGPEKAS